MFYVMYLTGKLTRSRADPSSTPYSQGRHSCTSTRKHLSRNHCSGNHTQFKDFGELTNFEGLCQRRHWPDPLFQTYATRRGYGSTVRVNNREYSTDVDYESEELAKNAAATRAYMICRNFSVNDGMYPGQRPGQGGVVQGLPTPIGAGRRNTCSSNDYDSASTSSAGTSPRNSDCGLDAPETAGRRRSSKSSTGSTSTCCCGRGAVRAYERCNYCLRDAGYRV